MDDFSGIAMPKFWGGSRGERVNVLGGVVGDFLVFYFVSDFFSLLLSFIYCLF